VYVAKPPSSVLLCACCWPLLSISDSSTLHGSTITAAACFWHHPRPNASRCLLPSCHGQVTQAQSSSSHQATCYCPCEAAAYLWPLLEVSGFTSTLVVLKDPEQHQDKHGDMCGA
jgi:hypothetical protein